MSYQQQQQLVGFGSRVIAVIAFVLGIAFFRVGPSTPPGRPAISLACLALAGSAAFIAFAYYYADKTRNSRMEGVEIR
jgi:hypothetical protein